MHLIREYYEHESPPPALVADEFRRARLDEIAPRVDKYLEVKEITLRQAHEIGGAYVWIDEQRVYQLCGQPGDDAMSYFLRRFQRRRGPSTIQNYERIHRFV